MMTSLFENSTLVDQRSVIRFLLAEGEKPVNIYSWMTEVYGENCMNCAHFYKWIEQFENDRDSVIDEHRSGREAGKVMLTVFWDTKGPIFCDYLEEQRTVNSEYYLDMLLNKVKSAMREKRRGSQWRGVFLQQDNARPRAT